METTPVGRSSARPGTPCASDSSRGDQDHWDAALLSASVCGPSLAPVVLNTTRRQGPIRFCENRLGTRRWSLFQRTFPQNTGACRTRLRAGYSDPSLPHCMPTASYCSSWSLNSTAVDSNGTEPYAARSCLRRADPRPACQQLRCGEHHLADFACWRRRERVEPSVPLTGASHPDRRHAHGTSFPTGPSSAGNHSNSRHRARTGDNATLQDRPRQGSRQIGWRSVFPAATTGSRRGGDH